MFPTRSLLAVLLVYVTSKPTQTEGREFDSSSGDIVRYINHANTTWKADPDFDRSVATSRYFLGALPDPGNLRLDSQWNEISRSALPDEFDSRTAWPNCPTISEIRNQAACGSCWAFSTSSVISDRICIASQGSVNARVSAEDIISCCKNCGYGCEGGYPAAAFAYFRDKGVITGGAYNSRQGCRPYSIKPCGDIHACLNTTNKTPSCRKSCIPEYSKTYHQDKYYGKSVYYIDNNEDAIKTNILKRGPVVAGFIVFADFLSYNTGVYQHVAGEILGLHAVKILGWGVERGTPYWLAANSWSTSWGDKGFFKILRGSNSCKIEDWMTGGDFKL